MVKNPPANAGDARGVGSIPGLGRSLGIENGNLIQYSCLENSMDRGAWQATVYGVAKSWTQLNVRTQTHTVVHNFTISSVQFSSVTQSCPTVCNPMD